VKNLLRVLAAFLTLAMVAAACGSSGTTVDTSAVDAAESARAAAEQAAADAKAEAESAMADAESAKAEAEAARADAQAASDRADAAEAGAADMSEALPLAGEVVRITGPERSAEEWNAIESAMEPFEAETGASVIYTGSADWEAEINVQIAAGNPPDISIFPQPGKLADFAREGSVLPLTDDAYDVATKNWSEAQIGFGLVDGEFYGMPVKNDLKSIVWHKPAVFEDNGYDIPQTWDELVELTNTMIADGITPWCVGIESGQATGWVFTDWTEDLVLRDLGPEAYDDWVANDLKFDSPEIKGIFEKILGLWNTEGAVFASGGSISSTHFASGPAEGLAADDCAMVRQASFFANFYEGDSSEIDVFYFPSNSADERPVMGGGNLTGAFNDRDATWAVMEYMGSPEYANARQTAQRAAKDGGISGFNTANLNADKSLWTPLGQGFVSIMQDAEVFRFDGSDLMPEDVGTGEFWTQATAMVNGEAGVDAAAAAIDAAWPES